MKEDNNPIPAALYARVYSDRQDVNLPVAALFGLAYVMRARSPSAPADYNMNISTA